MTAYACREHPTETVTWKGTGCELCTLDALGTRRAPELSDGRPEKKPRELR